MCFNKFMGLQIICTHQLEYLGLSNTKNWWFCGKHATWIVKVDDTVPLMSFQVWNPIQAESLLNSSYFQVAKHPKDPITLTIAMTILTWDSLAKDMMSYATSGGCWGHGWTHSCYPEATLIIHFHGAKQHSNLLCFSTFRAKASASIHKPPEFAQATCHIFIFLRKHQQKPCDHDFHSKFVLPIRYQFNMKSRYGKMR